MLLSLILLACTSPEPTDSDSVDTDRTDTDRTDTDTDTDADTDTDVGHTGVETPVIDCTALPQPPYGGVRLQAPRAYHGIGMSPDGYLVGSNGSGLIRATSPTDASLWVPGVESGQQMVFAPNGNLFMLNDFGSVRMITPAGASTTVMSGLGGTYGAALGPDNMIYIADQQRIWRLNPTTLHSETVLNAPNIAPKVVNFSPDGSRMYMGTISQNGQVWAVDLDADMNPSGQPFRFANAGGWHDGLDVDACGNIYLADYETTSLYRINPQGQTERLINFQFNNYGHGVVFGSGIGSWDDHSIYQPQPYGGNHVGTFVVGVPHRSWRNGDYITIH